MKKITMTIELTEHEYTALTDQLRIEGILDIPKGSIQLEIVKWFDDVIHNYIKSELLDHEMPK